MDTKIVNSKLEIGDYVKPRYALGPVWNASGKPTSAPPPPPAPSASLFSSESSKPSSPSNQKQGMSAVFQQISTGYVTSGLRKVTDEWNWNNTVSSYISTEYAPTVSVENTTGCQLYLSKDSLERAITTVTSREINVMPGASLKGDWVEHALP
uniref:Adenylate cyclase-associated CAP C-terminal domain-containing protein n=1 Tax=Brassica campestris TaxID=3711 RepID=M4DMC7_BRACM